MNCEATTTLIKQIFDNLNKKIEYIDLDTYQGIEKFKELQKQNIKILVFPTLLFLDNDNKYLTRIRIKKILDKSQSKEFIKKYEKEILEILNKYE